MASTWGSSWGTSWGTSWDLAFATVPDVTGLTQAQAVAAIEGAGFVAAVITASSDTVLEGLVISQDPLGGASAASGATVTITVSTGAGVDPLDPKYLGRAHNTRVRWLRKKDEEAPTEPLPEVEPPVPGPVGEVARGRGGLNLPSPQPAEVPPLEIEVVLPSVVVPIRSAAPAPLAAPPVAAAAAPVAPAAPAVSTAPAAPTAPPSPFLPTAAQVAAEVMKSIHQLLDAQQQMYSKTLASLGAEVAALRKIVETSAAREAIRVRDEMNRRRAKAIADKLLKDDDESS